LSGGCHGYQYKIQLDEHIQSDDAIFEMDGAKFITDNVSLSIINQAKIDFSTTLMGSQFQVVDIPSASSSCGCGASFDLKI